jgi:LacI family transcriptional regulator
MTVKTKATLKSLGADMNLSPATVSRILNGKGKEINLSDETISRVQAYAVKAGYKPHRQARNLRMGRTDVIGVCLAFPPKSNSDLIYRLFKGLSRTAMGFNKTMMVLDLFDDQIDGVTALKQLEQNNVDGIIASHRSDPAYLKKIDAMISEGRKVVMIIDHEGKRNCPRVTVDHALGAEKAVDYLIDTGCRRIAHMGSNSPSSVGCRMFDGWRHKMLEYKIYHPELFVLSREIDGYPGIDYLLKLEKPPDAIFCWSDKCAYKATMDLAAAGREDIRVVGFDNREFLHFLDHPFDTVDHPLDEVGRRAVEILLGDDMSKREILVEPQLIKYT